MFGTGKAAFGLAKCLMQPSQSAVNSVQCCSCFTSSNKVGLDQNTKSLNNAALPKTQLSPRYCCTIEKYAKKPGRFQTFDICKVQIEKPGEEEDQTVVEFIQRHHFTREPSILNLHIPEDDPYLALLAKRYATANDRWLAYIFDPSTRKRSLFGVMSAFLIYPNEAEKWYRMAAQNYPPVCNLINFHAQCLSTVNLFAKYNVPCIYNIEVMAAKVDPRNQMKELMLYYAMTHAKKQCYPLVHVLATNYLTSLACARACMTHEWRKNYVDFVDNNGIPIFCPCTCDTAVDTFTQLLKPCGLGFPRGYRSSQPKFYCGCSMKMK